ncbi:MAG: M28 family peptidase [Candidatus Curtissbacteria bacterium]
MNKSLAKLLLLLIATGMFLPQCIGQDIKYVRKQLERLCSPEFYGRAYYKKGDSIAAHYLAERYKEAGLLSFGPDYFQQHSLNVNDLTEVSLKLNDEEMKFGISYMIHPGSSSYSGTAKPVIIDKDVMMDPSLTLTKLMEGEGEKIIILDSLGLQNQELYSFVKTIALSGLQGISAVIEITPTTSIGRVGRKELPVPYFQVNRTAMPKIIEDVDINVSNQYYDKYTTRNVVGYIPGKSEKTIVFTAHYDMIGSFGEGNYFPGASDNGSGTAMVLDLIRHFSSGKKPYYTIAFMLFSAEEAGLVGSRYYTDNPLFPLEKIELAINLDMVGTGREGVILFNGDKRPREAAIIQEINDEKKYMVDVEERIAKANSDHYPFHEKGVPVIFFLTKGPYVGVHNVLDTPDKLPLSGYENLFKLILETLSELQRQEID